MSGEKGKKVINTNGHSLKAFSTFQYDDGETGSITKKHGMGMFVTILFIAGENAGAGILALPYALYQAGWWSLPLMAMCAFDAGISGILIGKCWLILEERWSEFRGDCRYPYPAIGKMAYGNWMRGVVTACLQICLFGASTVILLICAELISQFCKSYFHLPFGLWILIIGLCLCPFMWLGSPGEMWFAAAAALATTSVAVVLILIDVAKDYEDLTTSAPVTKPTLTAISLAFGTFLFSFGGTAAFPTFQNDMKDKSKFTMSVIIGFVALLALYLPTAILGYLTYGNTVKNNIISTIPDGIKKSAAILLLSCHLFFAFVIVINGAVQEIESKLKIPNAFGWKRVTVRTLSTIFVIFIGETIPRFGKYLILWEVHPSPCLKVSVWEKIYYYKIIIVGVIGGISCSYSAMQAIVAPGAFSLPCYIDFNCSNE
uniref:Amino acid transporter transmembrane domain-containing protein n=1 Tax=Tetranychus urticae TaxID=32264 RepID=T1KQS2_TETUR